VFTYKKGEIDLPALGSIINRNLLQEVWKMSLDVEQIRDAVKLSRRPAYRIAREAGVDPTVLSKIINGYYNLKPGDLRVAAVARVLGING
jgi:hypothetical protein